MAEDAKRSELQYGQYIRKIREKLGMTREALAERAGANRTYASYLWEIEDGRKRPSIDTLVTIAQAFGLPAFELLRYIEKPTDHALRRLMQLIETETPGSNLPAADRFFATSEHFAVPYGQRPLMAASEKRGHQRQPDEHLGEEAVVAARMIAPIEKSLPRFTRTPDSEELVLRIEALIDDRPLIGKLLNELVALRDDDVKILLYFARRLPKNQE